MNDKQKQYVQADDLTLRAVALCDNLGSVKSFTGLLLDSTVDTLICDIVCLATFANGLIEHLGTFMGDTEQGIRDSLRDQILASYGEELPAC